MPGETGGCMSSSRAGLAPARPVCVTSRKRSGQLGRDSSQCGPHGHMGTIQPASPPPQPSAPRAGCPRNPLGPCACCQPALAPRHPTRVLGLPQPGDHLWPLPSWVQSPVDRVGCGPGARRCLSGQRAGREPPQRLSAAVPAPGVLPELRPAGQAECLLFDLYPRSALLPGVWAAGKKSSPLSHAPRHILMN